MGNNLELSLKIKALVDGVKEIDALANEIKSLAGEAKKGIPDPAPKFRESLQQTKSVVADLRDELARLFTLGAIATGVKASVDAVRQAESAFRGLEAVANNTGVGIERAFDEATKLAADGLMTVADASKSLQNLLSRGYNLDEAVQTITRLKDAAAFNRAAHLSMSEAVLTATEGLKNENSILVDNAGVTKNVSIIWTEYADSIGKTVATLTAQEKVQAEVAGIVRETEAQLGNAAKAANGLEGKFAALNKSTIDLKTAFGSALIPALTTLFDWGAKVMNGFVKPFLGGFEIMAIKLGAFVKSTQDAMAGNFDQIAKNWELADQMALEVVARYEKGVIPAALNAKDAINQEAAARRKAEQEEVARRAAATEAAKQRKKDADNNAKEIDKSRESLGKITADLGKQIAAYGQGDVAALEYRLTLGDLADEIKRLGPEGEQWRLSIIAQAQALKELENQTWAEGEAEKARQSLVEQGRQLAESVRTDYELLTAQIDLYRGMLVAGAVDQETFNRLVNEAGMRFDGLDPKIKKTGDVMTEFAVQASRNIQSTFADFLFQPFDDGLKGMLKKFGEVLRRMVAELLAQKILMESLRALAGAGGSTGAFFGPIFKQMSAGVKHSGGSVAGSGVTRNVSPLAFMGAPRYHTGGAIQGLGLKPGEVPIIAQQGESVIPRGGISVPAPVIEINNYTGQPVRQEQSTVDGKSMVRLFIGEAAADVRRGGELGSAITQSFGLRRPGSRIS